MTEWLAARAIMYRLLGRIVTFPLTAETLHEIAALELDPDAPPALYEALTGMQSRLHGAQRGLQAELNAELSRLTCGPGLPPAVPFASYYLDPSHMLFGPETQAVMAAFRAAGYVPTHQGTPADHVALELEFMAIMAVESLEAAQRGDRAAVDATLKTQIEFISQHLGPFASQFCRDLRAAASEPFFRRAADLLAEFIEFDTLSIGSPADMAI